MIKTTPTSVLLIDDHLMILELCSRVIASDNRFHVCGNACSSTVGIEMAKALRPDIVLMDVNISPVDGFEATRLIRKYSPSSKVIGFSVNVFPSYAKKMKAAGAKGFITKSSPVNELFTAMLEVIKGNIYFSSDILKICAIERASPDADEVNQYFLTKREVEIIHMIKKGLNSKEIAKQLLISYKTVHIHRNNIFKKLQVCKAVSMLDKVQKLGI